MQRVADRDVGHGEAFAAEPFARADRGGDGAKARAEPARVILRHLRLAPLGRLETGIAEVDRLREGERGLPEMQPVQIGAVFGLDGIEREGVRAVPRRGPMADGRRFRHPQMPVHQQRHRAERIVVEITRRLLPRREGQHAQAVGKPRLLQRPERPERARVGGMVQNDGGLGHGISPGATLAPVPAPRVIT